MSGRLWVSVAARDPAALELGDDMRLRSIGQLRGVRRTRQHLLDLQPQDARGQRPRKPRAVRPQRLPVVLSLPRRQPDRHQLRRHDLVCTPYQPLTLSTWIDHVADVANATGHRPQGASGSREYFFRPVSSQLIFDITSATKNKNGPY